MSTNRPGHWSGGEWFTIPSDWLDSGLLATLTRTELLAVFGYARHADFQSGEARPGIDRIAGSVSTACNPKGRRRVAERAVAGLVDAGFLTSIEPGGGRGRATVYRLQNPGAGVGDIVIETPARGAPIPRPAATKTPTARALNPGAQAGPTYKNKGETNHQNISGADGGLNPNRRGHGMGEVTQAELGDVPGWIDLHRRAVEVKHVCDSERDRLKIGAAAVHALRIGKNPPALFADLVRNQRWANITEADEQDAHRRIKAHLHGAEGPRDSEPEPEWADA